MRAGLFLALGFFMLMLGTHLIFGLGWMLIIGGAFFMLKYSP